MYNRDATKGEPWTVQEMNDYLRDADVLKGGMTNMKCFFDSDGDGDCNYCATRGGCQSLGGPFTRNEKYRVVGAAKLYDQDQASSQSIVKTFPKSVYSSGDGRLVGVAHNDSDVLRLIEEDNQRLEALRDGISSREDTREGVVDNVNHPSHYTSHPSGIECIQVAEHMSFCLGSAVKYCWRCHEKHDDPIEDLRKAVWYLEREIKRLEKGDDR